MTSTVVGHPSLRGRPGHRAGLRSRRFALPGQATGSFWLIAAVVTVLNMIGLVMVMSASSVVSVRESGAPWGYFRTQLQWTVLGLMALAVTLSVSLDFWRRHARLWLGLSLIPLALVLVPGIGQERNGATRWLEFGGFQVQPSEFVKVALLIFIADLLARRAHRANDWRWTTAPVLTYLALVTALIMAQPNLGTTIIIAAMVFAVLWAAGTPLGPWAGAGAAGALVAGAFVAIEPFRRSRFMRFLDPMADPDNTGLQNVQSLVALANGGWFGRGLGRSTVKWGYLPFAWNDFIFAVIAEEFGVAGALIVLVLFVSLAAIGWLVSFRAEDRFALLMGVGITTWLTIQAVMNIGAVVGIMPITGVPLPFISVGGSAMVVNLAAIGLLLNIARHPGPNSSARSARQAT